MSDEFQHWPIYGVNLPTLPRTLRKLQIRCFDPVAAFSRRQSLNIGAGTSTVCDLETWFPDLESLKLGIYDLGDVSILPPLPTTLTVLKIRSWKKFDLSTVVKWLPPVLRRLELNLLRSKPGDDSSWKLLPQTLEQLDVSLSGTGVHWIPSLPHRLLELSIRTDTDCDVCDLFQFLPCSLTSFSFSGCSSPLDSTRLADLPKTLKSFSWDEWSFGGEGMTEALLLSIPTTLTHVVIQDCVVWPSLLTVENMPCWRSFKELNFRSSGPLQCALPSSLTSLHFLGGTLASTYLPYLTLTTLVDLELADINDDLALDIFPHLHVLSRLSLKGGWLSSIGTSVIPRHQHLFSLSVPTGLFLNLDALSALPPGLPALILNSDTESAHAIPSVHMNFLLRSPMAAAQLPRGLMRLITTSQTWMTSHWVTSLLQRQQEISKEIEARKVSPIASVEPMSQTLVSLALGTHVLLDECVIAMLPHTLQTLICKTDLSDPEKLFQALPGRLRNLTLMFSDHDGHNVEDTHLLALPRYLYTAELGSCPQTTEMANKYLPPNLFSLSMDREVPSWFNPIPKFQQLSTPHV